MSERRNQTRYIPPGPLRVYNRATGKPIGRLANLSAKGAMLVTKGPVRESNVLKCRVDLEQPILGQKAVLFDAECLWSRKNVKAGWWESGYCLKVTGVDAELIQYLTLRFRLNGREARDIPDVKTVDMANRRESARYELTKKLAVYEQHSYRQIGWLADLSFRGMRIIGDRSLSRNTTVQCRVKLPREIFRQDYLVFETECMWSNRLGESGTFESGHRIMTIKPPHDIIIVYLLIHFGKPLPAQRRKRIVV